MNNYSRNSANREPRRKRRRQRFPLSGLLIGLLAVIAAITLAVSLIPSRHDDMNGSSNADGVGHTAASDTEAATEAENTAPTVGEVDPYAYTEMTLLAAGDIMYHQPQIDSAFNAATGEYDFSNYYRYIKSIVSSADYAVVNFEATLSGNEYYTYSGYPTFNAPDSAFTTLLDAGFDMMLFANNHCYDYAGHGLLRTQQVFDEHGVDYIGAKKTTDGKTYKTVDVNGIKLGMLNSTDDMSYGSLTPRTVNGITIREGDLGLMDIFNLSLLDEFYAQTEQKIADLRAQGADLIVYFIHWGSEYQTVHNETQTAIAQKLCELGVDVIIGGHPHVVQDAEILTSSADPSHKTVCFYSLGNLVSNQNRLTMGDLDNKEYTENGLMVELTVRKYATGECVVTDVTTIPLWVHRYNDPTTWVMQYDIVPLETALSDPAAFGLYSSSFGVTHAAKALEMTNATLGGITDAFARTVTLPSSATEE